MTFWAAAGAATAGNLVGSLIAYSLGRLAAARLAPTRVRRALHRCDALFSRHGSGAVFVARLMPLARTFVSLPAGFARVGIARFVAMTALGCGIWAAAFILLGTLVGGGWRALSGVLGLPLLVLGVATILMALLKSPSTVQSSRRH
jgi:membrane protein DedA with SNARE-associated domain